jgi:hypothetical protein
MKEKLLNVLFVIGFFLIFCGGMNYINPKAPFWHTTGLVIIGIFIIAIPVGYVKMKIGRLVLSFLKGQEFREVMNTLERQQPLFGPNYKKESTISVNEGITEAN